MREEAAPRTSTRVEAKKPQSESSIVEKHASLRGQRRDLLQCQAMTDDLLRCQDEAKNKVFLACSSRQILGDSWDPHATPPSEAECQSVRGRVKFQ